MKEKSATVLPNEGQVEIDKTLLPHDPRSFYNVTTERVREALLSIPDKFWETEEEELEKAITPTPTFYRLKYNWWQEYERALTANGKMSPKNIWYGVCSAETFFKILLKSPMVLAWMCKPVSSYKTVTEEALSFGVKQLRKILEFPLVDKKGKLDPKQAQLVLRIVAFLDTRIMGAPVQRTLSVNVNTKGGEAEVALTTDTMTLEQVNKKLWDLENDVGNKARKLDDKTTKEMVIDVSEDSEGTGGAEK